MSKKRKPSKRRSIEQKVSKTALQSTHSLIQLSETLRRFHKAFYHHTERGPASHAAQMGATVAIAAEYQEDPERQTVVSGTVVGAGEQEESNKQKSGYPKA